MASEECLRIRLASAAELQLGGSLEGADGELQAVAEASLGAGLTSLAAEALLRRSATQVRLEGITSSLALLDSAAALVPEDPVLLATVDCQRATVLNVVGSRQAGTHAESGLARLGRSSQDSWNAPGDPDELRALARCLLALGQYWGSLSRIHTDEAVLHLSAAAGVMGRVGDGAGRAAALQWMGGFQRSAARYPDALVSLEAAVAEARDAGNRSVEAWASLGLAGLHRDLGDPATARPHMAVADSLLRETGDRVGLGWVRPFLAEDAIFRNRPGEALRLLDESEVELVALGDRGFPMRMLPLRIRALRAMGAHAEARRAADLLLEASTGGAGGREPIETGSIPLLVAVATALDGGDVVRAHQLLESAPPFGEANLFARWVRLARSAEVAARMGATHEAATFLREGLDVLGGFRRTLANPELSADLRILALGLRSADLLDPDLGLATVIAHMGEGGRTAEAFSMASELRAWTLQADRLRSQLLDPASTGGVEAGDPEGEAVLTAEETPASRLSALLRPDEALLFYITGRGREPTSLFVLTSGSLSFHRLPPLDDLAPLLRRLELQVRAGEDAAPLRLRVGEALLGPALSALGPDVARLVVVPDQGLNRLPFDALLIPEDGGGGSESDPGTSRKGNPEPVAVVERYWVTSLPSPGMLAQLRLHPVASRPGGVLALAQPRSAPREPWSGLSRLRWAGWETRGVARSIPGSRRLQGSRATPEAFLDQVGGGYSAVHLAVHAVVDQEVPARSAILLSPVASPDGELTLSRIEGASLGVPLVVLSACSTGDGQEVGGEGLRGPARAFLSGGAASVVATAWPVEDRSAARQMRRFYQYLGRGLPVDEALAMVKRERIAAGHPPSDWAAFQLFGEGGTRLVSGVEDRRLAAAPRRW